MDGVLLGDNLELMRGLDDGIAQLIYMDPPFNTGREQARPDAGEDPHESPPPSSDSRYR